jgi:hypothetical protein
MSGTSTDVTPDKSLGASRTAIAVAAGVGVALVIATAGLWLHYGTAVFYEMIVAGIAACL